MTTRALAGKTALVTGARTGIGRATAIKLASMGAAVALAGRAGLDPVAEEVRRHGVDAFTYEADLSEDGAASFLATEALASHDIDILVNNAGTIIRAPAVSTTGEDWNTVISVNLTAVFTLCQGVGARMVDRGNGKIINIASLLSFQGGVFVPAYTASKHAVAGLTKALANEWGSHGVTVNAVAPGYIETNNTEALRADPVRRSEILTRIPMGRWGRPEDVAGAVGFLAGPDASYVNGHVLVVDGGWLSR